MAADEIMLGFKISNKTLTSLDPKVQGRNKILASTSIFKKEGSRSDGRIKLSSMNHDGLNSARLDDPSWETGTNTSFTEFLVRLDENCEMNVKNG